MCHLQTDGHNLITLKVITLVNILALLALGDVEVLLEHKKSIFAWFLVHGGLATG